MAATAGDRCPVCSSTLAADQRYCVECGQRLPHARPAFMSDAAQAAPAAPPPRKSRSGWSPNGVLIAGIGTLLLAMGVGVLIGHYAAEGSTPKHTAATPIQVVPSTGATGAGSTGASTEAPGGSTGGSASHGASHSTSGGGSSGGTAHPSQAAAKPPNPTVQVGQHGSGQGYQHHEFTGHFFGKENEENAGEEAEEEPSSGGKKKK
jgi:hypothetical protein